MKPPTDQKFKIVIDRPKGKLTNIYSSLYGWYESPAEYDVEAFVNNTLVKMQFVERPALKNYGRGFIIYIDFSKIGKLENKDIELKLKREDGPVSSINIEIDNSIIPAIPRNTTLKKIKRDWLLKNIVAPRSQAHLVKADKDIISFSDGSSFKQTGLDSLNLMPPEYGFSGHIIEKSDQVSAHRYSLRLTKELEKMKNLNPDFWALDFGAGLRTSEADHIINMEVFDYPSTDILCVGQELPFPDATFDMVFTLAVLEHVDDPFACAKEIIRVLKPGGKLFSGLPFMQPEHGYPGHYFNATRQGHRRLFDDAINITEHFVDNHQHPIHSLKWILRSYRAGLPVDLASKFTCMTMQEILDIDLSPKNTSLNFGELRDEIQWKIASATTIIGEKK